MTAKKIALKSKQENKIQKIILTIQKPLVEFSGNQDQSKMLVVEQEENDDRIIDIFIVI